MLFNICRYSTTGGASGWNIPANQKGVGSIPTVGTTGSYRVHFHFVVAGCRNGMLLPFLEQRVRVKVPSGLPQNKQEVHHDSKYQWISPVSAVREKNTHQGLARNGAKTLPTMVQPLQDRDKHRLQPKITCQSLEPEHHPMWCVLALFFLPGRRINGREANSRGQNHNR